MLRASLGKVVHTVREAGTYAAKVPPQELHKIAVRERAVGQSKGKTYLGGAPQGPGPRERQSPSGASLQSPSAPSSASPYLILDTS
jgi:hypothetical protein